MRHVVFFAVIIERQLEIASVSALVHPLEAPRQRIPPKIITGAKRALLAYSEER